MALSFSTVRKERPQWGIRSGIVDITFDNSYPTGGWAIAASDLGIEALYNLEIPGVTPGGYLLAWDRVNGKIKAFEFDYDASADGAAKELAASSAALDGVTVRCRYIGR